VRSALTGRPALRGVVGVILGGFVVTAIPAAGHTTAVPAGGFAPAGPTAALTRAGAGPATLYAAAAVSANDVWAVGGSGDSALAGRWNGHRWARVPVPDPRGAISSALYGVATVSADDVWAVGFSTSGSGQSTRESALAEHWNGHAWAIVPSPDPGAPKCQAIILFAVTAVSASDVWASGYACAGPAEAAGALVEHWDGHRWAQAKAPATTGSMLFAVTAVSAGNVWAVGDWLLSSGVQVPLVEHWDGRVWARVASPRPSDATTSSLNGVAAVSAGDVWAVGTTQTESAGRTLVEHWDGQAWAVVPSPSPGGATAHAFAYLEAVTAVSGRDLWAVGYFSSPEAISTLTERWDGRAWARVASPDGSWGGAMAGAAAAGPCDVWAVGQALTRTLRPSALAERWDGHVWQRVTPVP
jgi:hypothetical protein